MAGLGVDSSFSGAINGSGSLIKAGAGTLTLTGANAYGGTTTVSGPTSSILAIGPSASSNSSTPLSNGLVQLQGGTLALQGQRISGGNAPIAVTGWTENMIVGVGQTFANAGLTATMDNGANVGAGGNTWYALGQNTGSPSTGLPLAVQTASQFDPTTSFSLQPAGQNNAILINGSQVTTGTLTLTTPANYAKLEVFGSSGGGANVVNYTLNFAGGSTQSGSLTFNDWFGGDASPTAYNAGGRINAGGYDSVGGAIPTSTSYPSHSTPVSCWTASRLAMVVAEEIPASSP